MKKNTNLETFINYQKSEATKVNYTIDITSMLDTIGKAEQDITTMDLMNWTTTLRGYASATQHRRIASVKSYFRFLYKCGVLDKNVAQDIEQVRAQSADKIALTPEQLNMLIAGCRNAREKAMIVFMANTGVRISELINITLEQYLEGDEIQIVGKGNKIGYIYINEMVREYVDEYLKSRYVGGCDNLFVSNQGTPMKGRVFNKTLKNVAIKAGIDPSIASQISNHTMRRTTATLLNKRGETLTTIQHTLRHSSPTTTARYIKNTKEDVQRALATPLF